jgi:hypothetical protein
MPMSARPRNGRHRRQLPANIVYRTIQATGGPVAVGRALRVSEATVKRWRRAGRVSDARAVLEWARLRHPEADGAQLALARALAGCRRAPVPVKKV